jgi:hypothetical protein
MALYFAPRSNRPQIHSFSNSTQVLINHNLGYKPMVQIILSDGTIAEGEVSHTDSNSVLISFQISLSGEIILR